jgi:hypothetical protein
MTSFYGKTVYHMTFWCIVVNNLETLHAPPLVLQQHY